MTWRIGARESFQFGGHEVRLVKYGQDGAVEAVSFNTEPRPEGVIWPDVPILHGPEATAFLQAAMDAAYEAGLRPSGAQDERHIQAHLKDMREISRHLLKMDHP
jgi:hypothetical protein